MTGTGILIAAAAAKRLRGGVALAAICAMLGSCAGPIAYNDFDTAGGISKKDYESLLGRRGPAPEAGADVSSAATPGGEPPIPSFQSVIAAPSAPELADTRRVSIAVTETTPVRDILIELTRKANVDLEMDPRISGGVIMTATDRPLIEVVERIAELAELRVRFERNILRVEVDDPYMEQYQLDVLNQTRTSTSTATSSTDAQSASQALGAGGGGGGSNKSDTSVSSNSSSNFWGDIATNIGQILGAIQTRRTYRTETISATFVPEADVGTAVAPAGGGAKPAAGGPAGAVSQALGLARNQQSAQAQIDANVADAVGVAGTSDAAPATSARTASSSGVTSGSTYSVNPQSGIVTVFATMRQQRAVERYLRTVRAAVMQQIVIEAKILEVALDDQYRSGIDWTALLGPNNDLVVTGNFNRSVVPPTFADPTISAAWGNAQGDLDIAAQLINQFGTVRTLSNPRLTVINNQVAMLKVARNQVFFELDVTDETDQVTDRRTIRVDSQIKTIPVGIVMSVQPAVDARSRQINLSLRPSITRITGFIDDPGVALQVASVNRDNPNPVNVTSQIPIIETREIDSVVTIQSGQTIVMGGLMQEDSTTNREGFPGLMDVPLLGQAVSQNIKENRVTELVIFIRATLANDTGTVSDEDIRLYKTFGPDPRPIVF